MMSAATIVSYVGASYAAARPRFRLGIVLLGVKEMGWSVGTWGGVEAVSWLRRQMIPLSLLPSILIQRACSGSAGFAAGQWMAQQTLRVPRARFLGWVAFRLGAAFFHSSIEAVTGLRSLDSGGEVLLLVMTVGVPGGTVAAFVAARDECTAGGHHEPSVPHAPKEPGR
jgi:hypothetical protein